MAFRHPPRFNGRVLALAVFASFPAFAAFAQAPYCITARSQCPVRGMQPPGTQCACPDYPGVWGMVGMIGSGQPIYPGYQHHGREELRNDDLDDGDDVLAGPRRHRHRRDTDDDYP